ncbi:MAG: T9SS type A sorting domain-containing protein [Bacteroidetes bacterium]|nr:T9SS type A sorting domain-containing protein [Bacteroidota bacterium]
MRTLSIIFTIGLLSFSMITKGQWVQQNSGTTNTLWQVHFPVQDTGYVVGFNGTILKTTDGGTSWNSLNSGTSDSFWSVHFINASEGYVVGPPGTILKTVDGGLSWINQISDSSLFLASVFFVNSDTGFAAGVDWIYGMILKTTDGGINWNKATMLDTAFYGLTSIHFPVPDTGYAVYYHGILKSVDSGNTWKIHNTSASGLPGSILQSCHFTDANTGYIGGWYDACFAKTTDGGNSWTDLDDPRIDTINNKRAVPWSINFPTKKVGYAVGDYGAIYKTGDSGNQWEWQDSGPTFTSRLNSVHFTDANTGYAVGDNGTILKTNNGGVSSINDINLNEEVLSIYPNPASDRITIELKNIQNQDVEVNISNVLGEIIYKDIFHDVNNALNKSYLISHLPDGLYFVTIRSAESIITKKIILNK